MSKHSLARLVSLPCAVSLWVAPLLVRAAEEHGQGHGDEFDVGLLGLALLQLGILGFFLVRYAGPPIRDFLFQRSEAIRHQLDEARGELARAENELSALRQRLDRMQDEAASLANLFREQAVVERDRMRRRAEETASRLRDEAERVADLEIQRANQELRETAATLSTSMAADILRDKLAEPDDRRLVGEFVDRIQGAAVQ